jgi:hypothetical protein
MEIRQIQGLTLKIYTDTMAGFSYLTFLSNERLEKIRLPVEFSKFKQNYLLTSNYLLDIEIIKTKKNWVLKDIFKSQEILRLQAWSDFLKHSEQTNILLEFLREEQEVDILPWLKQFWSQKAELDSIIFKKELEIRLGFA